jgi:hypothetical protein
MTPAEVLEMPLAEVEPIDETRLAKAKPYMEKYHKWAEATGAKYAPSTLIAWDEQFNNSKVKALFTDADALEAGYKTLYSRVFTAYYQMLSVTVKPKTVNTGSFTYEPTETEKTTQTVQAVKKGVFMPGADASQRAYVIAAQEAAIRSAVNTLLVYKYGTAKLSALFEELMETANAA